jgi:hypothetical protein
MSRNLGALTLLDPSGPAWPVMGVLYLFIGNLMYCYAEQIYLLSINYEYKTCTV